MAKEKCRPDSIPVRAEFDKRLLPLLKRFSERGKDKDSDRLDFHRQKVGLVWGLRFLANMIEGTFTRGQQSPLDGSNAREPE